ncbi:Glu-tRNA(Gln) amidotransferase subunit GatE [bacterium]|nr:Glu-tRNA(Gln) amidotransferase subunit GatE [bacterium]MBT3581605.1 Glu-tRNA(Gln) amidotransferase subunit GatE [bacterium]MBT4552053.1 Glu-tRNA(Gln) amidotransferase subunit GatE [bacterium]MBT7087561.1 Glu-tRNA(Gln) amidotransferase subunit GatE [bacterium]
MVERKIEVFNNYEQSQKEVGYIARKDATQKTYDDLGFMSGLEVHQQLDTKEKLFCRCPAGIYHQDDEYNAELIRHMRPTLSELGEYDGTALMEFKTKKEIVYRINDKNSCTYEIDDTPPFPLNKQALERAIIVSLACKLNIVGEVHITRKQYLDGSIPAGFQRTVIIGVDGEIYPKNKKVRLIQLSLEEDSCREISDIKHKRVYKTDRLGMPLIETVTYPDMKNPDEVKDACDYIRFLNRSTGLVRTGTGASRQDVNVSCTGGTRVEIKGVAHTKWIPELTHNEVFRQWALLKIRDRLKKKIKDSQNWKIKVTEISFDKVEPLTEAMKQAQANNEKLVQVILPGFKGILSYFTQPGRVFADEISDRLKVIACLEKPNMIFNEHFNDDDAEILVWTPEDDLATTLETIEERCQMAFEGVPAETRKSLLNGTTLFERVLPGANRMYPDTDSPPISLQNEYVENLRQEIPVAVVDMYNQLQKWGVPTDTYTYILSKNLYPVLEKIVTELKVTPKFIGGLLGHKLKNLEGKFKKCAFFTYEHVYDLIKFVKEQNLDQAIIKPMLKYLYQDSKQSFENILQKINFQKVSLESLKTEVQELAKKFSKIKQSKKPDIDHHWIVGQIKVRALGNIALKKLKELI